MLTVRGQHHPFSTCWWVFLWKCQSFWHKKCLDLRGTQTPNLQIHAECSNHLSYQGQTWKNISSVMLVVSNWQLIDYSRLKKWNWIKVCIKYIASVKMGDIDDIWSWFVHTVNEFVCPLQQSVHLSVPLIMIMEHLGCPMTHLLQGHIYASVNWVSLSSGNGSSPVCHQAITRTNAA